jgi:hypothetical protein
VSDPWARPGGAGRRSAAAEVIEIDLVGSSDDTIEPGGTGGATPPPNWRKVVALSSVAGLVLGAIVATVVMVGDDDEPPSPTSLPREQLAALVTTPPTLPPIDGLDDASVDDAGVDDAGVDAGRGTADGPDRAASVVSIPEFPATFAGDGSAPDPAELVPPGTELSRRVTIVSQRSTGGEPIQTRIAYDAESGRYELVVDLPVGTGRTIYDPATRSLFEQEPSMASVDSWRRRDADAAFAGLLTSLGITVDEYFEQLLLGPVRADDLDGAVSVATDDFTYEVAGFDTQRFIVTLPLDSVGVWQTSRRAPGIRVYEVYVDDVGRILRTQGITSGDDDVVALQHVVSYPDDVPIALPDPDTVTDPDGDEAQANDRAPDGDLTAESLRPTYGELADLTDIDVDQFDVGVAFGHLFSSPPAASTVDVIWADGGQRFVSQRDDVNDRRSMLVTSVVSDDVTIQIDDGASATILLTDDQRRNWTRLSNTGLGSRRLPVDERLISGPLLPATVDRAEIEPGRFVALADGTVAREVRLLVEPGVVTLPSIVPIELDVEEPVEVHVYVGAGVVHEIHVLSNTSAQIFVQTFDLRAEPEIGLPDPSTVSDG